MMDRYYLIAKKASKKVESHPGLTYLRLLAQASQRVLDVGCGEGTRLHTLLASGQIGWGIDINPKAISWAKKQYPHHHFQAASAEALPFSNNTFDLVYSAFALEHVLQPQKTVLEMIRVCKPLGRIVIICPNFGAPNRRSPVSTQNPYLKFLMGWLNPAALPNWAKVKPRPVFKTIDDDTTVEPDISSLISYLKKNHLRIVRWSSLWELEPDYSSPRKFAFHLLGQLGLPPFCYWGPQILVSAVKNGI